jgi:hypothetical protein
MHIRVPRVALKTVPVTCRLDADLHADLEAYAAAYAVQYGETIPLPTLITTIVRDYLQKDPAFMRQRRQAEAPPRARPAPARPETLPRAQGSQDGALSRPSRSTDGAMNAGIGGDM